MYHPGGGVYVTCFVSFSVLPPGRATVMTVTHWTSPGRGACTTAGEGVGNADAVMLTRDQPTHAPVRRMFITAPLLDVSGSVPDLVAGLYARRVARAARICL